jgi:mono/diheme cytochrome c family protein
MKRMLCNGGAALLLLVSVAGLLGPGGDEEGEKKPVEPLPPHARAPHGVVLTVDKPDKQLAWIKDIERKAAAEPGRFSKSGEQWVDSKGEYAWDKDNECYWQTVSAETLTNGRQDFVQFCASCHGMDGDGYGRSAQALRPPPRDFRQSNFKFTKVLGDLPNDDALIALLKHGLDGTPMFPWAVAKEEARIRDILAYIKSIAPAEKAWHDGTSVIGDVVYTPPDPWAGKEKEAVAAGEKSYHIRQCWSCHPAYVTAKQLNDLLGQPADTQRDGTLNWSKKKEGGFEVQGYVVSVMPPDFTWNTLRYSSNVTELFQTIAAGVKPTMPTWGHKDAKDKGAVPDDEIWAIAHYVRHLVDTYKDKPERAAFIAGVRGQ